MKKNHIIIYSLSGYSNPLVFKNLTDVDINIMEKYMREKAMDYMAETLSESIDYTCDALLDDEILIETFGEKYAKSPEKFEFLPGQISFIKVLAAHVKKLVDEHGENTGLKHFNEKKKTGKTTRPNLMQTIDNIGTKKTVGSKLPLRNLTHNQLADQLFQKFQACLKTFDVNINCNANVIEVEPSGTYGNIKCPLCDETEKPRRVYYNCGSGKRSGYWVLANYEKHLKTIHSLVVRRLKMKRLNVKIETTNEAVSKLQSNDELIESKTLCQEEESIVMLSSSNTENVEHDVNDSVEYLGPVSNVSSTQMNKNDDPWLYTQISEQIQQMIAATLINGESEHRMKFCLDQADHTISIIATIPDGNCLFSALSHQLWPNHITSSVHKENIKKLRSQVVEHILKPDNFSIYEFMLHDRVNKSKIISTDAELTMECKLFVRHGLSRNGAWGGLETIKAVSTLYDVNVVIINEHKKCNMVRTSNQCKRTIVIAYRLNSEQEYYHYDSVSDMTSDGIYSAAEFILKK